MPNNFGWSYPAGVTDKEVSDHFGELVLECEECGKKFVPDDSGNMNDVVCQKCCKLMGDVDL